jgi:DNA invertase Pin-like site-specific DNA recombinase
MRILPAIRLSLSTDATTSPERQFESIKKFADYKDHELVPITEADYDLDVSGAVSPFDRPGLGRWLKPDKLDDWDTICAAKLDRISRSLFDFTSFVHWLEAHGKALIILDPELDLTTNEGRVMANVLMTFAEYEREVIGTRVKDAYDKLIRAGQYTGGMVLFGYRPVKLAKGWGVEVDPEYAPVVREMADRYLRYESLGSIVRWLNETGVPCPKDIIRMRSSNPRTREKVSGAPLTSYTVRHIFKSPAILGAITNAKDEPMRDEQGMVIYRAAPLLADDPGEARDIYEMIQARLAQNPVPVRINTSPLTHVAFCAECGNGMYRNPTSVVKKGKQYDYAYYLCEFGRRRDGSCGNKKNFRAEPLEDAVFGTLLELAGHRKLRTKRVISGRDQSEDMARVEEQIVHLDREILKARRQRKDFSDLQAQKDAADAEMDRLIDIEPEPARIEYEDTGQTFQAWWDKHDTTARNAFLRDQGVKVVISPDPLPSDLALGRPEMLFSVAAIERPGMYAILYMGDLAELLSRPSELSITVPASLRRVLGGP